MRILLSVILAAAAVPASAQLALPPAESDRPLSRLAPLSTDTVWHERFEYAGELVSAALALGSEGNWPIYFGGRWLSESDRARINALLYDERMALSRVLRKSTAYEQVVLGWVPADGKDAYAALADRPEADAVICWREKGSGTAWPQTSVEAEDLERHACVRVSGTTRFDTPAWRAFIDAPVTAAD